MLALRNYCESKKCLNCNIGKNLIIKNEKFSELS